MPYVDVERILVAWLTTHLGVRCVTDVPANLFEVLPVVQLARVSGRDIYPTLDQPRIDVDCYAANRGAANTLAEQVRTALRFTIRGQVLDGAVVGVVQTILGPAWRPYDNTNVKRVGATYAVTVHSQL
jgi:hypothetical protein